MACIVSSLTFSLHSLSSFHLHHAGHPSNTETASLGSSDPEKVEVSDDPEKVEVSDDSASPPYGLYSTRQSVKDST
jgi:hypothetical protein